MPKIIMGNDDFILFVRKNCNSKGIKPVSDTATLGANIGDWFSKNIPHGSFIKLPPISCVWGSPSVSSPTPMGLPYTATQFEFEDVYLIDIYRFLSTLA